MADVSIPIGVLENYASGVNQLSENARADLEASLRAIDLRDQDMVMDLMAGACRAQSLAATHYAAEYYRGMSILQTGRGIRVDPKSSYDRNATDVAVRGIYNQCDLGDGELDEEMLMNKLLDRVAFEVNRASKVGVWRAGRADRRDVRYARIPVGAETCAWCLMTAGLGYWFMTEEAASHTHAHCDCVILPSIGRGEVHIPGYDSTVYRDMWRAANKALNEGAVPQELADRVDYLAATVKGYRKDTNGALAVMRWQYGLK